MTPRDKYEHEPLVATGLSGRHQKSAGIRRILRLAQGSLLVFSLMTLGTSCIVADPPQYTDPVRTPPQLNLYLADPPLSQVVPVLPNKTGATFRVDVQSEDAGEELFAVFWEDYNTTGGHVFSSQRVPPSTYNSGPRTISSTPFTPGGEKECHTVTLLVAHASTFLSSNLTKLDGKLAQTDAAIVTWWVNVNPSADALDTLVNCPIPSP